MTARREDITPFGLWLLGWKPALRRFGSFGRERGWRLQLDNGLCLATLTARPDFDVWRPLLIFWGHRMCLRVLGLRLVWWRGRRVVRPIGQEDAP